MYQVNNLTKSLLQGANILAQPTQHQESHQMTLNNTQASIHPQPLHLLLTATARAAALDSDGLEVTAGIIENASIRLQQIKRDSFGIETMIRIKNDPKIYAFLEIYANILSSTFVANGYPRTLWKDIALAGVGSSASTGSYYPEGLNSPYIQAEATHYAKMHATDALCALLILRIFYLDLLPAIEFARNLMAQHKLLMPGNTTVTNS